MSEEGNKAGQRAADAYSAAFVTALAHFYRGEMNRANVWRTRLDVTTNWAILTTAGFLSFGFGGRDVPHFVFILATIFVFFFLIIEARRYKYFDLWRWRVALVNENFFASILCPEAAPLEPNWHKLLSYDLQHSQFKITLLEAFGRRLRRNYIWVFIVLGCCWLIKISIHPVPVDHFSQLLERAAIYHLLDGGVVIAIGVIFNMGLLLTAIMTRKQRDEVVRIYPSAKSRMKMSNF